MVHVLVCLFHGVQACRFGFLTTYFATYFIKRFGPDAYAVSGAIAWDAEDPSVAAILYCEFLSDLRLWG